MPLNDVDLETLQFLTERVGAVNSAWAHLMDELEPEKLPVGVVLTITGVGRSITEAVSMLVEESRKYGYDGPGVEEP